MSDKESKTEKATAKKRQKFRDDGKIAVSKEVVGMSIFLMASFTLVFDPLHSRQSLISTTRGLFSSLHQIDPSELSKGVSPLIFASLSIVLPIGFVALVSALVSGFGQTKGLFTFKKMKPNLAVLNPFPKLKQMFASKQALTTILMSLGKVSVVALVVINAFYNELPRLQTLGRMQVSEVMTYLTLVTLKVAVQAGALLVLFAIIDFLLIRHRLENDMKMTKQEVKDEHKDVEGNPEIKRQQRMRMREVGKRMMANVPKAAVVVVNPTHYAVALQYEANSMGAPKVVAKGRDNIAAKIREIAREHRVPIIRNPPLTRKLFKACAVDQEIPPQYYGAVAEVLAIVMRLRKGLTGGKR